MANSKYEHVKVYEKQDILLPSTYIVIRIDGRGFHKYRLSQKYEFIKPNDRYALDLMNAAARAVMEDLPDVSMAYGLSDEFSFVFGPSCDLFERRESKILSTVVSTFTAYYVYLWSTYLPNAVLSPPLPSFDARAVIYPSARLLRDYLSWRQVDCHINNLYNTTFWAMVQQGGMSNTEAEAELKGTLAADKNEILFSRFGVNYNSEPEVFKKGTIVYRRYDDVKKPRVKQSSVMAGEDDGEGNSYDAIGSRAQEEKENERKLRTRAKIATEHVDLINDDFWLTRPWLLNDKPR
ncbi:MAG: hypothetical protein Q9187_007660 [Circinaria calcarea]